MPSHPRQLFYNPHFPTWRARIAPRLRAVAATWSLMSLDWYVFSVSCDVIARSLRCLQVWYSEVFVNTAATAMVSVGVGNGTRATRTSVIQNEGSFTYNAGAPGAGVAALTQVNFDSTVNVAGAELYARAQKCRVNDRMTDPATGRHPPRIMSLPHIQSLQHIFPTGCAKPHQVHGFSCPARIQKPCLLPRARSTLMLAASSNSSTFSAFPLAPGEG